MKLSKKKTVTYYLQNIVSKNVKCNHDEDELPFFWLKPCCSSHARNRRIIINSSSINKKLSLKIFVQE